MAHQINWPVPDHVVMVELDGGIMADEVQIIADQLSKLVAAAESSMVHMLIDAQNAGIGDKIWSYSKLRLQRHPKVQLVIIIGDSRISGLIIAIFSKLINLPIHYRESLDEALKVIAQRDMVVAEYLKE